MRKMLIALAVMVGFRGTPALLAQHAMADSARPGHMAMMMQHHSTAAVDLLLAHRDSLKLTDDQVKKLAGLREHFAHSGGHAMHGMGMREGGTMGQGMPGGQGMARGQGMAMGEGTMMGQGRGMNGGMAMEGMSMTRRPPSITFDRVPGKSVPRIRKAPAPEHNAMCPMASLNPDQKRLAHGILDHLQHD